jgi:hypothetical protein
MSIQEAHLDKIDVKQHFHVMDAFSMPRMFYDEHTRTFHR